MGSYHEQARVGMQEAAMRLTARNGRTLVADAIARAGKNETAHYIHHPHRRIIAPQCSLYFEEPEKGRSVFEIHSWTGRDGGVNLDLVFSDNDADKPVTAQLAFGVGNTGNTIPQHQTEAIPITSSSDLARILRVMRVRDQKEVERLLGDSYEILGLDSSSRAKARIDFVTAMQLIGTEDHQRKVYNWWQPD